jgi:hypothetical protein
MSYERLLTTLCTVGPRSPGDLGIEYAFDVVEHPDFDIPMVMATTPTGRVLLVVEGKKELVGPIIEKAKEQMQLLGEH